MRFWYIIFLYKEIFYMTKKIVRYLIVGGFLVLLYSCNNFGAPTLTVTVAVGQGVLGTPVAGTYTYNEFDTFDYSYDVASGGVAPRLLINTYTITNNTTGTVTGTERVYTNLTLNVAQLDIRGLWHLTYYLSDGNTKVDEFDLTLSGNALNGGTFVDVDGRHGVWQINDKVNLTLTYTDWPGFVFSVSVVTMSGGTWVGSDGQSGLWGMEIPAKTSSLPAFLSDRGTFKKK
jgi:hypothetical protein